MSHEMDRAILCILNSNSFYQVFKSFYRLNMSKLGFGNQTDREKQVLGQLGS